MTSFYEISKIIGYNDSFFIIHSNELYDTNFIANWTAMRNAARAIRRLSKVVVRAESTATYFVEPPAWRETSRYANRFEPVMTDQNSDKSPLNLAATKLREISLSSDEGMLLGSEDDVLLRLGVSRNTLKQAARLIEREGLVTVKRGVNGGYYSARPTENTIKSVVNAYLETIDVNAADIVSVTTILWLEVVRRASQSPSQELVEALRGFITEIESLTSEASFHDVDEIEQKSRVAIFALVDCRYIELIMRINQAFGSRHPFPTATRDDTPSHREFVIAWRKAKALELQAIADGDMPLAEVAARNCRRIWDRRVMAGTASHS